MARGGKRDGAGRPAGSKSPETIERDKVSKMLREKIMGAADVLYRSQLHLAVGQTYLYKIEKEKMIGPKGGVSYKKTKPILVTSQIEIESYLEDKIVEGDPDDDKDPNATYYFITAKDPNNMAIDSMLDRALGMAVKSVEITGKDGQQFFKPSPDIEKLALILNHAHKRKGVHGRGNSGGDKSVSSAVGTAK